jgi:hypothetical protein
MRTTVDIDEPVLKEVKRLVRREGKALGRVVSDLLAEALGRRRARTPAAPPFVWTSRQMDARVDLDDKDAVQAALDASESAGQSEDQAS